MLKSNLYNVKINKLRRKSQIKEKILSLSNGGSRIFRPNWCHDAISIGPQSQPIRDTWIRLSIPFVGDSIWGVCGEEVNELNFLTVITLLLCKL